MACSGTALLFFFLLLPHSAPATQQDKQQFADPTMLLQLNRTNSSLLIQQCSCNSTGQTAVADPTMLLQLNRTNSSC
jgi:hypothetical protein